MKKNFGSFLCFLIAFAVLVFGLTLSIAADSTEEPTSQDAAVEDSSREFDISGDPDSTPVTMGFLMSYLEQYKKELLEEIGGNGGNAGTSSGYSDVKLNAGQTILLSADSEVIFRGGSAVAITSAHGEGEGLLDISADGEIFSGEALKAGHIYIPAAHESKKAILITGQSAYFTLKGTYEIV